MMLSNKKLLVRRDTAENWELYNPLLADGKFAWEKDTNMFKIGNGKDRYQDLPYPKNLSRESIENAHIKRCRYSYVIKLIFPQK